MSARRGIRPTSTVTDVAREAGVSVSTAARVLRQADYGVSPTLQEKVRKAADNVGYVPNLLARNLRHGDHPFIGLLSGYMLDPYFGEIAEAVTEEANARSLLAIVSNMQRDPRLEIAQCQRLWEHRVSGLILTGGGFDQRTFRKEFATLIRKMRRAGVIVVSVADRDFDVPTFSVDNDLVGRTLAEHLVRHGHREIGVVIGPAQSRLTELRAFGIEAVLSDAGVRSNKLHSDYGVAAGVAVADRLIALNPRLTAIIAGADTLAVGVVQRLQAIGYRIPDDISVIGVGNTVYARLITPHLSTIDVSIPSCSTAAVRYVVERLAGRKPPAPGRFPVKLVEAGSVGTRGRSTRRPKADRDGVRRSRRAV
jgi:LacI family transcriptional regulator